MINEIFKRFMKIYTFIINCLLKLETDLYNILDKRIVASKFLPSEFTEFAPVSDFVPDLDTFGEVPEDSKDVSIIHQMKQSCQFVINVPGHKPRKNSHLFDQTRKHLIDELDTPCWICSSKENRQVHHFIIEMSMANACDFDKLKKDHPDFPDWNKVDPNNPDTFYYFVDHPYNMMVLCQNHHTGTNKNSKGYGIHYVPHSIWSFQKYVKGDFKFLNSSL